MFSDEDIDDIAVVKTWRTEIASYLSKFTTAVTLSDIEISFPRPTGIPVGFGLESILQNDPFERFAVSGSGSTTRARRIYRVDDLEIREHVQQWQENLAAFLSNNGSAISLSDLGSQVVRPTGVPISVKLIDVLKTDETNRFIINTDASGGAKAQFNYANLTEEQILSLQGQWRDNVSRFLSNYSTSLSIQDIAEYVSRPPFLDATITLYDILKSDENGCFAISGEYPNIRVRRVYRVDDPTIASHVENWRSAVSSFLASQSISVSLSDIGSSIARPPSLPPSVKLIDVLKADEQQRFVLSGDGNSIRAALSTSARQRVVSPALATPHSGPSPSSSIESDVLFGDQHPATRMRPHVTTTPDFRPMDDMSIHGNVFGFGRGQYGSNNSLIDIQQRISPAVSTSQPAAAGPSFSRQGSPRLPFYAPPSPIPPRPPLNKASHESLSRPGSVSRFENEGRADAGYSASQLSDVKLLSLSDSLAGLSITSSPSSRSVDHISIPPMGIGRSSPGPVRDSGSPHQWTPDFNTPPEFVCPLSKLIMKEPVVCADGITYDKACIDNIAFSRNMNFDQLKSDYPYKLVRYNETLKRSIVRYIGWRSTQIISNKTLGGGASGNIFANNSMVNLSPKGYPSFIQSTPVPPSNFLVPPPPGLDNRSTMLTGNLVNDIIMDSNKAVGLSSNFSSNSVGANKLPLFHNVNSISSLSNSSQSLMSMSSTSPTSSVSTSLFTMGSIFDNTSTTFGASAEVLPSSVSDVFGSFSSESYPTSLKNGMSVPSSVGTTVTSVSSSTVFSGVTNKFFAVANENITTSPFIAQPVTVSKLCTPIDIWMRSIFGGFDERLIDEFCGRFRDDAGFATVGDLHEAYTRGQLTFEFVARLANFKLGHHNRLIKALESVDK
jgi:hypothetical protein